MSRLLFLLLPWLVLGAGCATDQARPSGPVVRPGLVMLTAEQAEQRGLRPVSDTRCPQSDAHTRPSAPMGAATVQSYQINRAVDATDPDLMHEAHVVYRRDPGNWRLDGSVEVPPRVGSAAAAEPPSEPLSRQELTAFLVEQRKATAANEKAIAALFEAVESLTRQQRALADRSNPAPAKRKSTEKAPVRDEDRKEAGVSHPEEG